MRSLAALTSLLLVALAPGCAGERVASSSAPAAASSVADSAGADAAADDPDWLTLTWSADPSTTLALTWRTRRAMPGACAQVVVADAGRDLEETARTVPARSEQVRLTDRARALHFHSVELDGLAPDTLYAVRVGDGAERWSAWSQHRTAAAEPRPFSFLYFGDVQNGIASHWPRLVRAAARRAPDARFALYAGDIVAHRNETREWDAWHRGAGWLHAELPVLPVVGNHEYWGGPGKAPGFSRLWRPQFTLPLDATLPPALSETAYAIDYQGLRLVVLNGNAELAAQARWLERVLAEDPQPWTVVAMHQPLFSGAEGRDEPEQRRLFLPLCERFDVDLLLQGHDHVYTRGHTVLGQAAAVEGVAVRSAFVVSVAGTKRYPLKADGWSAYAKHGATLVRAGENTQLFQVVTIAGARLLYQAFTATGERYDAFELIKDPDGGKRLVELDDPGRPERRFSNTQGSPD